MTVPGGSSNGSSSSVPKVSAPRHTTAGRRTFQTRVCWRRGSPFQIHSERLLDALLFGCTVLVEKGVLLLGPVLICFALTIMYGLGHTFFTIILPMLQRYHDYHYPPDNYYLSIAGGVHLTLTHIILAGHIGIVVYFLSNIAFHYFMCVTTRHTGPKSDYHAVVKALRKAQELSPYPDTPEQVQEYKLDYETKMQIRMQRRRDRAREMRERATNGAEAVGNNGTDAHHRKKGATGTRPPTQRMTVPSPAQIRSWMILAPDEWGYCLRSHQPKPPRSHFDHVSKSLILNLDHYCPWMFNAVGYFNYRHFCSFLWLVQLGMYYGFYLTWVPFQHTSGPEYREQLQRYRTTGNPRHYMPHSMVPLPFEKFAVSLSCMLCLAVGIAVTLLGGFHFYLVWTGQTTIEFHGNWVQRRQARKQNKKWKNPYDLGGRRNWQQVFGSQRGMLAAFLIPSRRKNEFLPLPLPGDQGRWNPSPALGHKSVELQPLVEVGENATTKSKDEQNGEAIV